MPDPAPASAQAADSGADAAAAAAATAAAATSTGDTSTTPEALHEAAYSAVTAWQNEADEAKKAELKTAATTAVETARKALEAQKTSAAANKPPDKYELKAPEGSLLKPEALDEIKAFAKANKLTQAQADLIVTREHTAAKRFFDGQQAEVHLTQQTWAKENLAHPDVAGDPVKLKAMAEGVKRVVEKFGPEGMVAELDRTGLGNNPQFLSLMNNVFKGMSEDQLVKPGSEASSTTSSAQLLFGQSLKDAGVKPA